MPNTSLMRSQAFSSGRPANDTVGDAAEEPAVGGVAMGAGEWVAPPNINPGTTVNSSRPDTGRVTGVHDVGENMWEINNQVPTNLLTQAWSHGVSYAF